MTLLHTRYAARLEVTNREGEIFYLPVVGFTMTFAINELPTCAVQLGIGGRMNSARLTPAISLTAREALRQDNKCRLITLIDGDYADDVVWNQAPTVAFRGKIQTVSNMFAKNAAALNVTLRHWLSDLQSSTILTGYANPLDPRHSRLQAASYEAPDQSGLTARAGMGALGDALVLKSADVEQDLWGGGIKEFVSNLLSRELFGPVPRDATCADQVNRPSDDLIDAWRRIEGPSSKLGTEYSKWAVPAQLSSESGTIDSRVLSSLIESITHDPVRSYQQSDAWSKLVGSLLPFFRLMLVPRIHSAIVAPSIPGLRTPYCHRVVADDIVQLDSLEPTSKPLEGVTISANFQTNTGLDKFAGLTALRPTAIGCYINDTTTNNGRVAFVNPPKYLSRVLNGREVVARGTSNRQVVSGVAAAGTRSDPDTVASLETSAGSLASILQDEAKAHYFAHRAQSRTLRVNGKLRFDIAPGSMVEVMARTDQFRGINVESPHLQGLVSRVSITLDASRRIAMTSLMLHYVRTIEENADDKFTIDRHPLYLTQFNGATLADAYENEECS